MALRWTLAIASQSHGLTQSTVRVTGSYSTTSIRTFVSSRGYAANRKPQSDEERQRKYEERKARQRLRYQSDAEFREKYNQRLRDKYANPEHRETFLQKLREKYANDTQYREKSQRYRREKYANDPQYRERRSQKSAQRWFELKSKLEKDPKAYQQRKDSIAELLRAKYRAEAEFRWSAILSTRLRQTPRHCEEIVWPLHKPVLYPTKTNHTCATCGRKRFGGSKLWYVTRLCKLNRREGAHGDLI